MPPVRPWRVDELEIIGYANVLDWTMVPSVVPPVFRLKAEQDRVFVPPYSFNAGYLCNATELDQSELEHLKDRQDVTLFDMPMTALDQFELWVGEDFQVRYESQSEARDHLKAIAKARLAEAETKFRLRDFDAADRLATIALSANDREITPLVIKAAVRRAKGQRDASELMQELATPSVDGRLFRRMVDS